MTSTTAALRRRLGDADSSSRPSATTGAYDIDTLSRVRSRRVSLPWLCFEHRSEHDDTVIPVSLPLRRRAFGRAGAGRAGPPLFSLNYWGMHPVYPTVRLASSRSVQPVLPEARCLPATSRRSPRRAPRSGRVPRKRSMRIEAVAPLSFRTEIPAFADTNALSHCSSASASSSTRSL